MKVGSVVRLGETLKLPPVFCAIAAFHELGLAELVCRHRASALSHSIEKQFLLSQLSVQQLRQLLDDDLVLTNLVSLHYASHTGSQ